MYVPFSFWIGFFAIVAVLLALDLGILNRKVQEISVKKSLWMSGFYFLLALCFGFGVMVTLGNQAGENFFTGYFIEESLSFDNIFFISLVFLHFRIPRHYQHRVLFWGILGAIIMRGLMIFFGIELIEMFHPVLYLFGGFLIITGLRMLWAREERKQSIEENRLLHIIKKFVPVTHQLHDSKFFIKESGRRIATPLFLTLVFVELADIIFAIDSVPAVLAVTTDPFVVYTSNIFAILGLRSLYFALAAIIHRFEYLKYSLALVLVFIGSKIFLNKILLISSALSLAVTVVLLGGGIVVSLVKSNK